MFEHSEFPQSIGTIRPMADSNPELSDNQHSDNDFEKIALPSEEETVESDKSSSKVRPGSSVTDRENSEQRTRMKKSVLDAQQDDQEQPATKCCWATAIDPRVQELIYWHNVKWTVLVFAGSLLILISLACFSLLSLISYASLFFLTFTFAYRLYGNVVAYFKKSKEMHPLNKYLQKEISIPLESVHMFSDQMVKNISRVVDDVRRLFLVERFVDSIKFALLLWLMTFIGSWFSGISLVIIGDVFIFTVPKFYSLYQKQIDEYFALVNAKLDTLLKVVQEKVRRKKTE